MFDLHVLDVSVFVEVIDGFWIPQKAGKYKILKIKKIHVYVTLIWEWWE